VRERKREERKGRMDMRESVCVCVREREREMCGSANDVIRFEYSDGGEDEAEND
jgi:hypothetical protein